MNQPIHHQVIQGAPDWHALRAKHHTASEAPAMMGVSKHLTRGELVRMKATGAERELYQRIIDDGHAAEESARPIAEQIIGAELYPATVTRVVDDVPLLASCDGLTLIGDTAWEHKLWNAETVESVRAGVVPECHRPQLDQQMIVTGATRTLFMCSDGTEENCAWCWYELPADAPGPLIAGWKQLDRDLANYVHEEAPPTLTPAVPDELPTLLLEITGAVQETNLATWQQVVSTRIAAINTDLQTDQDFADAEQMVKFLKTGEDDIKEAKAHAIAQTASIDELFKAVDALSAEMRAKRLELDKLVKARKETIRHDIMSAALGDVMAHATEIAEGMDSRVIAPDVHQATFRQHCITAMKSKRTIVSLRDAAAQVATDWKLELSAEAQQVAANLKAFDATDAPFDIDHLFPDLSTLTRKEPADFTAAVKARIADALEAQRKQEEQQRQREAERAAQQQEQAEKQQESPAAPPEPPSYPAPSEPEDTADQRAANDPAENSACADGNRVAVNVGGHRIWLSIEQATQLRDALTASIRQSKKEAA